MENLFQIKKYIYVFLFLFIQSCITTSHTVSFLEDSGVSETSQPRNNSYVCSCRVRIPSRCTEGFCGRLLTGTELVDNGRTCNFGIRNANVCYPAYWNPDNAENTFGSVPITYNGTLREPTDEDLEDDCNNRVREFTTGILQFYFHRCYENTLGTGTHDGCSMVVDCSATRFTETSIVRRNRFDSCNNVCEPVPFTWTPINQEMTLGNYNFDTATFTLTENTYDCGEFPRRNSQRVCFSERRLF